MISSTEMNLENGQPVPVGSGHLVLPPLSEAERARLVQLFDAGAARVPAAPEHWICGSNRDHDESTSYCYECAEKEIAKLKQADPEGEWLVDGGWGNEGDSTPFCEGCGKLLSNTLTNYGCEAEVDHFTEHGFDPASDDDCRAMSEVISARGWEEWSGRVFEREYERRNSEKYFSDLHALGRQILAKLDQQNTAYQPTPGENQ